MCVCLTVLIILCIMSLVLHEHMHSICTSIGWGLSLLKIVFLQVGDSSLHLAAYFDHPRVVKLLIQNGASSTQCNNVSVIVKQVTCVPLRAHVQVRYMVILCVYVYLHNS